jgi:hypothetical protein
MPSPRAAFSLLGLVAVVASLALKGATMDMRTVPDLPRFNRELADRLDEQGFNATVRDLQLDLDMVEARRGACRLAARSEETAELTRDFRRLTPGLDVIRFHYRGSLRTAYPRGEHGLFSLFNRMALRLGLVETSQQPLAIAANPACDLSAIDFGPLRQHPKR